MHGVQFARSTLPRRQIRPTGFVVLLIGMEPLKEAMTRTRLLLVEDDKDSLEVFSMILGERYTVFGYTSAVEALEAIDTAKPGVVVLDIGMHPVDGMQCLKAIRAMPGYRDIPAIALTGFARDVERQRFLDSGFQAVVVKPFRVRGELTVVIDGLANSAPGPEQLPLRAAAFLDSGVAMTASPPRGSGEAD